MKSASASCSNEISASPEAIEMSSIRSSIYAVLAQGFSHPDESVVRFFRECGEAGVVDCGRWKGGGAVRDPKSEIRNPNDAGALGSQLNALVESARSMAPEDLQGSYMRLFDPLSGPFPYETEQKKIGDFSKAQLMADIMGFYRAFGVEPCGQRPDHIASELEFMHYLTLKEGHALRAAEPENASLCRDAQEKFFDEHLATWTDALIDAMRAHGEGLAPFYIHLVDLLQLLIEHEKEVLR